MAQRVEVLEWDSDFFGVPIGRVALDGVDQDDLESIDVEARDMGLCCLFGTMAPAPGDPSTLIQHHGHVLVEIAIKFDRRPQRFEPPPTRSRIRRGTAADLDGLTELLDPLAPWSRFAVDPRFGIGAARRMFGAWLARAAREPDERLLLVSEDRSGFTGVSTNVLDGVHRVDLLGVLQGGTGAADALMGGLFEWAGEEAPTEAGPCAARNIAVLRYVERCGFKAAQSTYLFHRWLDDVSIART